MGAVSAAQTVAALTRRADAARTFHVEVVQDQVELALMRGEHHKVARAYVLYREERKGARGRANGADCSGRIDQCQGSPGYSPNLQTRTLLLRSISRSKGSGPIRGIIVDRSVSAKFSASSGHFFVGVHPGGCNEAAWPDIVIGAGNPEFDIEAIRHEALKGSADHAHAGREKAPGPDGGLIAKLRDGRRPKTVAFACATRRIRTLTAP